MTDSKTIITAAVRRSLSGARHLPPAPAVTLPPPAGWGDGNELATQFAAELRALGGTFRSAPTLEILDIICQELEARQAKSILAWADSDLPVPGLVQSLRARGLDVLPDRLPRSEPERRAETLARMEACTVGLTGADGALADTGTLLLCSGPGRPRLASLSVRMHIAVITPRQIWPSWAAWIAAQPDPVVPSSASNMSLISGPSRTGDIEMTLTVGVHGPRHVLVLLAL